MAVSKRLRYEILRRENHACRYCGGTAPDVALTVDHVIPTALGGSDQPDNLVTACRDCNAGKSASSPDSPLVADVAADAIRWAAALKQLAEEAQADRACRNWDRAAIESLWESYHVADAHGHRIEDAVYRPDDWADSIDQFLSSGLTTEDIGDAIRTAMKRLAVPPDDKWRYMCGICWTVLRQRQDKAAALLALNEPGR